MFENHYSKPLHVKIGLRFLTPFQNSDVMLYSPSVDDVQVSVHNFFQSWKDGILCSMLIWNLIQVRDIIHIFLLLTNPKKYMLQYSPEHHIWNYPWLKTVPLNKCKIYSCLSTFTKKYGVRREKIFGLFFKLIAVLLYGRLNRSVLHFGSCLAYTNSTRFLCWVHYSPQSTHPSDWMILWVFLSQIHGKNISPLTLSNSRNGESSLQFDSRDNDKWRGQPNSS